MKEELEYNKTINQKLNQMTKNYQYIKISIKISNNNEFTLNGNQSNEKVDMD